MLVVMQAQATEEQVRAVCQKIEALGYRPHSMPGAQRTAIGITGNKGEVEAGSLEEMPGVQEVIRVSKPYKLVSRDTKPDNTVIRFPGSSVTIGGRDLAIMAGPCGIESREQAFAVAERVARAGAQFLRGGAYKPRTSPYSFQGMGEEGLKLLREVSNETGLLVITEVMEISQIETMLPYIDCFQVGARNMQNFNLLRELGHVRKPVLMKRGIAATIEEVLLSAEYILSGGNYDLMLCERGIRTFETYTRNTYDVSAIPVLKKLTHLPMIGDPSHGTGRRDQVPPMARAAIAAGADGLLIEVHHDPDHALSDGAQSLTGPQYFELMKQLRLIAAAVGRTI